MILVGLTDSREHGVRGGSREFFLAGGGPTTITRLVTVPGSDVTAVQIGAPSGQGPQRAEPCGIVPLGSVGVLVWRPARKAAASGS
jgi:hypothetical protein